MPGDILAKAKSNRNALIKRNLVLSNQVLDALKLLQKTVNEQLRLLLAELDALKAKGIRPTTTQLFEKGRLKKLLAEIDFEVNKTALKLGLITTNAQKSSIIAAIAEANQVFGAGETLKTSIVGFDRSALEKLVGFASNESKTPLSKFYRRIGQPLAESVQNALIVGLGIGASNQQIASEIKTAIGTTTAHALTIARTETNNAYREASREIYHQNKNRIKGWIWISARDLRTCPICWRFHGVVFPTNKKFQSHPNCRCTMRVYTGIEKIKTGEAEFAELTEQQQIAIIGQKRFELYQNGAKLSDFIGKKKTEFGEVPIIKNLNNIAFSSSKTVSKPTVKPKKEKPSPVSNAKSAVKDLEVINQKRTAEFDKLKEDLRDLEVKIAAVLGSKNLDAIPKLYKKQNELVLKLTNFETETLRLLREPLRVKNHAQTQAVFLSRFTKKEQDLINSKFAEWNSLISKNLFENSTVGVKRHSGRAYHLAGTIFLLSDTPTHTYIHEIAHHFELTGGIKKGDILAKSIAFLESRTKGESEQLLSILTGIRSYGRETAKPDKFFHVYAGKTYRKSDGTISATEIVSMGIEQYFKNPLELAQKDFGFFEFIYNLVRGK